MPSALRDAASAIILSEHGSGRQSINVLFADVIESTALAGFETLGATFEVARTQERMAEVVGLGATPHLERLRVALV